MSLGQELINFFHRQLLTILNTELRRNILVDIQSHNVTEISEVRNRVDLSIHTGSFHLVLGPDLFKFIRSVCIIVSQIFQLTVLYISTERSHEDCDHICLITGKEKVGLLLPVTHSNIGQIQMNPVFFLGDLVNSILYHRSIRQIINGGHMQSDLFYISICKCNDLRCGEHHCCRAAYGKHSSDCFFHKTFPPFVLHSVFL